jgi:hypothetical protein
VQSFRVGVVELLDGVEVVKAWLAVLWGEFADRAKE